jgi:hypothetical protein
MTCILNSFNGKCTMFEGEVDENLGCDEDGYCICDNDENPSESCLYYDPLDEFEE